MFLVNKLELKEFPMYQNMPCLNFICMSSQGFICLLVDDSEPSHDLDVEVVEILKVNVCFECKIPRC